MIIPIYGKIKNVPNHQPVLLMLLSFGSSCRCHPSDRHDCCTKNALAPPLRPPEVASWGPGSHISDPGPAKTELGATQMCRRVQLHGIVMGYGGMVILQDSMGTNTLIGGSTNSPHSFSTSTHIKRLGSCPRETGIYSPWLCAKQKDD